MKKIQCPIKRVDVQQLQAELTAAGVLYDTSSRLGCVVAYPDHLVLSVADDANATTVRAVVAAHVPPAEKTAAEMKRTAAKQLVADDSPETIRLRAIVRVLYGSLVETRSWCNQLRQQLETAGMPTPPRLTNRTWEEAMQAALAQIDVEIPDESNLRGAK